MKKVRTIFMGTPEFSLNVFETVYKLCDIVCVVTKKDAYVGRKKVLTPSPIKKKAMEYGIDVLTPDSLKKEYEDILEYDPELIITCAYGKILPEVILDYPKYGCINIHASLLPKYRGSAPIEWALMNGERETGITLMYMDKGMDTGDIIDKVIYNIKDSDDSLSVHNELSKLGSIILEKNFNNIISGNITRIKQDDKESSIAPMITRDMERIDFNNLGIDILNKIKAFSPSPLVNTIINNEEIKIKKAHFIKKDNTLVGNIVITNKELYIECLDGYIYLDIIKPMGKKEMDIKSYLNGLRNKG